jgi:hypothetical protein
MPVREEEDNVTVQLDCAPDAIVAGAQTTLLIVGGVTTVTVAPVPVTETACASGVAPSVLSTLMAAVVEGATTIEATTPSGIADVFRPNAMQVYAPGAA